MFRKNSSKLSRLWKPSESVTCSEQMEQDWFCSEITNCVLPFSISDNKTKLMLLTTEKHILRTVWTQSTDSSEQSGGKTWASVYGLKTVVRMTQNTTFVPLYWKVWKQKEQKKMVPTPKSMSHLLFIQFKLDFHRHRRKMLEVNYKAKRSQVRGKTLKANGGGEKFQQPSDVYSPVSPSLWEMYVGGLKAYFHYLKIVVQYFCQMKRSQTSQSNVVLLYFWCSIL